MQMHLKILYTYDIGLEEEDLEDSTDEIYPGIKKNEKIENIKIKRNSFIFDFF